jgi:hypothetical protein
LVLAGAETARSGTRHQRSTAVRALDASNTVDESMRRTEQLMRLERRADGDLLAELASLGLIERRRRQMDEELDEDVQTVLKLLASVRASPRSKVRSNAH